MSNVEIKFTFPPLTTLFPLSLPPNQTPNAGNILSKLMKRKIMQEIVTKVDKICKFHKEQHEKAKPDQQLTPCEPAMVETVTETTPSPILEPSFKDSEILDLESISTKLKNMLEDEEVDLTGHQQNILQKSLIFFNSENKPLDVKQCLSSDPKSPISISFDFHKGFESDEKQIQCPKIEQSVPPFLLCKEHIGEKFTHYCDKCKKLVCIYEIVPPNSNKLAGCGKHPLKTLEQLQKDLEKELIFTNFRIDDLHKQNVEETKILTEKLDSIVNLDKTVVSVGQKVKLVLGIVSNSPQIVKKSSILDFQKLENLMITTPIAEKLLRDAKIEKMRFSSNRDRAVKTEKSGNNFEIEIENQVKPKKQPKKPTKKQQAAKKRKREEEEEIKEEEEEEKAKEVAETPTSTSSVLTPRSRRRRRILLPPVYTDQDQDDVIPLDDDEAEEEEKPKKEGSEGDLSKSIFDSLELEQDQEPLSKSFEPRDSSSSVLSLGQSNEDTEPKQNEQEDVETPKKRPKKLARLIENLAQENEKRKPKTKSGEETPKIGEDEKITEIDK